MSLLKYIERLKRMDDLIRRRATGTAEEFSRKLEISKSQLFQDLKEIRELGAHVTYCHTRKSYVYENNCKLVLTFDQSYNIRGGNKFQNFSYSSIAGLSSVNLLMHEQQFSRESRKANE